jgi:MFS family permease
MKIDNTARKFKQWISDLTVGGAWGNTQVPQVQHNLRWFWFDGLFASGSDNIYLNFISLYILALGATQGQIGLMSSLSNLTGAVFLLVGALLAERLIHRKMITLFGGAGFSRLALLMLVFVPILFKGQTLIWFAIAMSVAKDSFGNLSYPAWIAVINDTVPIEGRGRYFGSRNFVMGIAGMITTVLAGELITMFVAQKGYQIALGIAFVLGAISTYSYAHIHEPLPQVNPSDTFHLDLHQFFRDIRTQPQFIALIATTALWNLAVNISGPFFNVFMVKNLKFTASVVGILAVVTSLSALFVQNGIGAVSDRWGAKRVQFASMCVIPLLPMAWVVVTSAWHVAIINIFSGVVWAAFNLASFNLMLEIIPKDQIPRYSAVYQIVVTLSLALGALIGSGIVASWGFNGVFLASGVCRFMATGLFGWLIYRPHAVKAGSGTGS